MKSEIQKLITDLLLTIRYSNTLNPCIEKYNNNAKTKES